MINSMTMAERRDPDLLSKNPSRRQRIANGSGLKVSDVSKLITDFTRMRTMMQQMGMGRWSCQEWAIPFGGMGGGLPGMGNPFWCGMGWAIKPLKAGEVMVGAIDSKKKKKVKKKKGFGTL